MKNFRVFAYRSFKQLLLISMLLILQIQIIAQVNIPPDYNEGDTPSNNYYFYKNKGQLIDANADLRNEISYYTRNHKVNLFLSEEGKVSCAWNKLGDGSTNDSLYRIDIQGYGNSNPNSITSFDQSGNYLNYYLPHCGNGITDVRGYRRIVYENYFEQIDYHITSNQSGAKYFFVVHPGADPNEIELQVSGHDSLVVNTFNLDIHLESDIITIPYAVAYEVDGGGQMIPLSWQPNFIMTAGDRVKFNIGSYNNNNTLVFMQAFPQAPTAPTNNNKNNKWTTFIGGGHRDDASGVAVDDNGFVYVCGSTFSTAFNPQPGANYYQFQLAGGRDAYIVKFDDTDNEVWATYLGGTAEDRGEKLDIDSNGDIFMVGETRSNDLPNPPCPTSVTCYSYSGSGQDVFITKLTNSGTGLPWLTYYGGSSNDNAVDIEISNTDQVHVIFNTESTNCPTKTKTGAYNDNTHNGASDGFITIFNNQGVQDWATYFGSDKQDEIGSISIGLDRFFIHGDVFNATVGNNPCDVPSNGGFPLCDPTPSNNTDYFENSVLAFQNRGFLSEFSNTNALTWSTFFSSGVEAGADGSSIFVNVGDVFAFQTETELEVYITGSIENGMTTTGCTTPTNGEFPLCAPTGIATKAPNSSGFDIYVAKFGMQRDLKWATAYGDIGSRDIAISFNINNKGIFIVGNSALGGFPTVQNSAYYHQSLQLGSQDPIIVAYNHGTLQPEWATPFGGSRVQNFPREGAADAISTPNNIYMVGLGHSDDFPFNCDNLINFCRKSPGTYSHSELDEGFITRFDMTHFVSSSKVNNHKKFKISPNPANDYLNIDASTNEIKSLFIYNQLGQLVIEKHNINLSSDYKVDINTLPVGLYYISLQSDNNTFTDKFIKQ